MLECNLDPNVLTPLTCPYRPDTTASEAMRQRAEAVRLGYMKSVLDDHPL